MAIAASSRMDPLQIHIVLLSKPDESIDLPLRFESELDSNNSNWTLSISRVICVIVGLPTIVLPQFESYILATEEDPSFIQRTWDWRFPAQFSCTSLQWNNLSSNLDAALLEIVSCFDGRNLVISFHDRNLVISSTHLKDQSWIGDIINWSHINIKDQNHQLESSNINIKFWIHSFSLSTIMDRIYQSTIGVTSLSRST